MRILLTVGSLGSVGGVQVYVRELARWLVERDHSVAVYGPHPGDAARQMRRQTIAVTDDLSTIGDPPDVVHGHNALETMEALLRFPDAAGLFTCHAWKGAGGVAPRFPRLRHYMAVDETCADRLRLEEAIPEKEITVLLNAVDLDRYRVRDTPLPPRPKRALVFGNAAHEATHLPAIRTACQAMGIEVDVAGSSSEAFVDAPESILGRYDLVFAKARCALEAIVCGAAVILCDVGQFGGLVRSSDVPRLRRLNFGIRAADGPLTVEALTAAIASYDAADAALASRMVRETASADALHERILDLYGQALEVQASAPRDWPAESRAAALFLRRMAEMQKDAESQLNLVVQATHRMLRAPIVGGVLSRAARWLVARGRNR